jgi:hypothetical protein
VPVPETAPGYAAMPPQSATPPVEMGLLDTITESLFGDANPEPSTWTPLPLGTFFTEGWLQPYVNAPNADGGAPRQGFLDSFDGLFYRQWATTFTYTNDFHRNGNQYFGSWTLWAPFNRRFEMRIDVPFIVANKGGRSNSYHGNFGDLVVTPIFLLSESKNFTQTLSVFTSTATGKRVNGAGVASVNPQYQFWAGLPESWVVRGGFGPNVPTNDHGARTTMNYNLAIGKFVTPHDMTPFGDLVFYLAANGSSTMDNRGPSETLFFLTPGARCHLGNNWFILAGVEVPLTGPRTQSFAWAPEFQLVKGF